MYEKKWYRYFYNVKMTQGNKKDVAHYYADKLAKENAEVPFLITK